MKANDTPDVERKLIVQRLPVKLTRDELVMKGRQLAECDRTIERRKADRKSYLDAYTDEMELQASIKGKLVTEIENESEQRDVECTLEKDYLAFRVRTLRNDTGQVVGERPMEDHERQRALPKPEPEEEIPS